VLKFARYAGDYVTAEAERSPYDSGSASVQAVATAPTAPEVSISESASGSRDQESGSDGSPTMTEVGTYKITGTLQQSGNNWTVTLSVPATAAVNSSGLVLPYNSDGDANATANWEEVVTGATSN
jgi:hypothetical protein